MSRILTREDLSKRWKISVRSVDRWVRSKNIPFSRNMENGRVLFKLEEIEEWERIYMPKLGKTD